MKLFHFYRIEDHSGVSGTGPVVEGVQFTNGWCALRWLSKKSSVCFYQSLDDVKAIHGHGGKTEIIVHDLEPLKQKKSPKTTAHFELFMEILETTSRLINSAEDPETSLEAIEGAIAEIKGMLDELHKKLVRKKSRAA